MARKSQAWTMPPQVFAELVSHHSRLDLARQKRRSWNSLAPPTNRAPQDTFL